MSDRRQGRTDAGPAEGCEATGVLALSAAWTCFGAGEVGAAGVELCCAAGLATEGCAGVAAGCASGMGMEAPLSIGFDADGSFAVEAPG